MASSRSLQMPPSKRGTGSLFFHSQFTKPVPLPKDTNLSGKVAIVTGASTGLGLETCIQLLSFQLSHLILAVRSVKKGENVASKFRFQFPKAKIEVWTLEMTSYESIEAFARRVEKDLTRLDIAILNAGVLQQHHGIVESTGHENVIQVNYLSTALLSILLLPALKSKSPPSSPGRLTIVGSGVALAAKFAERNQTPILKAFDDPTKWDPTERYWVSKLLGHYFLVKLTGYVDPKDVIVNVVDPGLCRGSGLHRDVDGAIATIMAVVKWLMGRTTKVGATTYVDAAVVKGAESHGSFVMDWAICPLAALLYAPDKDTVGERLWNETMKELDFIRPLVILKGLKH